MNALVADAHGLNPEDLAKERCPKCGSPIELKTGRFGPYLACVKYKDTCDYVKSLRKGRAPDRPTDEKCHLCGSPMVIKTGRFGEFLACTTYPGVQGHPRHPARHQVPQVPRGRPRRAAHQARQVVLGLRPLSGLRLLHLEQAGAGDLPRVRLGRHGEEGEQGRGRDPHLPQVRQQDRPRRARGGGAGVNATVVGGGSRRLGGGLGARGARRARDAVRDAAGRSRRPRTSTDRLAELVCSNSFKSVDLTNAHGLLKAELRALGSLLLPCADVARVPGGTALAVDREVFSQAVHERVTAHPNITVGARRGDRAARRPASSPPARSRPTALAEAIAARLGSAALAFYDAIAPVVSTDSLDHERLYALSRYGKGEGDDYLNAPLDRDGYERFLDALIAARPVPGPRLRPGALLRGLPAGGGDGAPGPRDAALRPHEAGRASRSAHRAGSRTPWSSSAARTARGRCGTWSASRPGSGSRSSSGCSG